MSTVEHAQPGAYEHSSNVNRLGLYIFIMSEAVLFANLIAGYLYLRFIQPQWPPEGTGHLDLVFPTVNTLILIASGVPMHLAHKAAERGNRQRLIVGLALTILLGGIFIAGQGWEYANAGFTPSTNVFGSTFFTLTGFHGAHVIVGLTFLVITFVLALRGRFTAERNFPVEAAALYWHFVDVVWVVLFAVLYVL
jgi:heme/copper-type cytochrome/quinol oxidase subunit 3